MKTNNNKASAEPRLFKRPAVRIACLLVLAGMVCAALLLSRSTAVKAYFAKGKVHAVIADYTDNVVLDTLTLVVEKIDAFNETVTRLQVSPSDDGVKAAAQAWRAARAQWQAINTFAYGPCAFYDFNKQVASWPFDRPMVDYTLSRISAGDMHLDSGQLRRKMYSTHRGFFTAEYLLFRDGRPRSAAAIGAAELQYLKAVSQAMLEETLDFQASWVGTDHMPRTAARLLEKAGLPPRKSYAEEFRHPGAPSSRYHASSVVLQEMLQESQSVVEDTCPLIEEWLGTSDPRKSESRYSRNALADILNLFNGVENAYLGGEEGHRGRAMADLVADKNKVLDRRIRIALADVRFRVAEVGDPYAAGTEDRELKIRIATASCWRLFGKIGAAIPPVCMDPVTQPWAAYVQ